MTRSLLEVDGPHQALSRSRGGLGGAQAGTVRAVDGVSPRRRTRRDARPRRRDPAAASRPSAA